MPLKLIFTKLMTPELLPVVVRNLVFRAWGSDDSGNTRTLEIIHDNGTNRQSTALVEVAVTPINTPPLIGAGAPVVNLDANIGVAPFANDTVHDVDSTDFGGGRLVATVNPPSASLDQLGLFVDTRWLAAGDNVVVEGVSIGIVASDATPT